MPVYKCNGKWKIGRNGECKFESKAKAEAAFKHWVKTQHGKYEPETGLYIFGEVAFDAEQLSEFYGKTFKPIPMVETLEVYDEERVEDDESTGDD